jgi:hypothetical protein
METKFNPQLTEICLDDFQNLQLILESNKWTDFKSVITFKITGLLTLYVQSSVTAGNTFRLLSSSDSKCDPQRFLLSVIRNIEKRRHKRKAQVDW